MLYSKEKEGVAVPENENEALSDVLSEKCNELPAQTSKTFDGKHCAEVKGPYDLVDIIFDRRAVSLIIPLLHLKMHF